MTPERIHAIALRAVAEWVALEQPERVWLDPSLVAAVERAIRAALDEHDRERERVRVACPACAPSLDEYGVTSCRACDDTHRVTPAVAGVLTIAIEEIAAARAEEREWAATVVETSTNHAGDLPARIAAAIRAGREDDDA